MASKRVNQPESDAVSIGSINTWSSEIGGEGKEYKKIKTPYSKVIGVRLNPFTIRQLVMDNEDVCKMAVWEKCTHLFFNCLGFGSTMEFQIGEVSGKSILKDARTYIPVIRKIKIAHPSISIIYSMPPLIESSLKIEDIFAKDPERFWGSLFNLCDECDGLELNFEIVEKIPSSFYKSLKTFCDESSMEFYLVLNNSTKFLERLPSACRDTLDKSDNLYLVINSFGYLQYEQFGSGRSKTFKLKPNSECGTSSICASLHSLAEKGYRMGDIVVGMDTCGLCYNLNDEGYASSMYMVPNKEMRRINEVFKGKDEISESEGSCLYHFTMGTQKKVISYDSKSVQNWKLEGVQDCRGVICGDLFFDTQNSLVSKVHESFSQ